MLPFLPHTFYQRTPFDGPGTPPSGSVIQSIQQGTITIAASSNSNTATISAIVTANSILIWNGRNSDHNAASVYARLTTRIAITNTTTITATRESNSTHNVTVAFTVIEFASGVNSIQAGTTAITTGNTSVVSSALGTAVGANAFVIWLGASTATAAGSPSMLNTAVTLTDSTHVTVKQGVSLGVTTTIGWMVVDLDSSIVSAIEQRVLTSTAASATDADTITSVTTTDALLIYGGVTSAHAGTDVGKYEYTNVLTNATTVTCTREAGVVDTASRSHYYTVVSFAAAAKNGNVQRGTIALAAAASNTATISSVDTAKSFVNWAGVLGGAANANVFQPTLVLTNGTTVTAAINAAGTITTSFEVIQFN